MQKPSKQASRYFVRISLRGPSAEPFGWEIGSDAGFEMRRSTQTFATRIQALLDSVRGAAALEPVLADEVSGAAFALSPAASCMSESSSSRRHRQRL
jgi:hypothetical protein